MLRLASEDIKQNGNKLTNVFGERAAVLEKNDMFLRMFVPLSQMPLHQRGVTYQRFDYLGLITYGRSESTLW